MTATTSRKNCPICDAELTAGADGCPNCNTNSQLFAQSAEAAFDFYNDGLDLARAGDRAGAIAKMQGAVASDPNLVDAHIVLGKLIAQGGTTSDLEQALMCWGRARAANPTEEQSRKLDHCTRAAQTILREAVQPNSAKRRRTFLSIVSGGLTLAAVSGVLVYVFRPMHPASIFGPGATLRTDARPALPSAVTPGSDLPANPTEAVSSALKRPDITVTRSGDRLALQGTVQTPAEKSILVETAAYAAHALPTNIDVSKLKVKQTFVPRLAVKKPAAQATRIASVTRPAVASAGNRMHANLSAKTYTVQPGDTILAITHKFGRNDAQWKQLLQSNRRAIRRPDSITAGAVLKLPAGWKPAK